jgi:hypothetical protein
MIVLIKTAQVLDKLLVFSWFPTFFYSAAAKASLAFVEFERVAGAENLGG